MGAKIWTFLLASLEPAASEFAWMCIKAKSDRDTARELAKWNRAVEAEARERTPVTHERV